MLHKYLNPCGFIVQNYFMQQYRFLCSVRRLELFLKLPEAHQSTQTHNEMHAFFFFFSPQNQCNVSPVSLYICMDELQAMTSRPKIGQPCIPWGAPISLLFILPSQAKPQVLEDFTLIHAHWFIIHSEHAGIQGQELQMLTITVALVY